MIGRALQIRLADEVASLEAFVPSLKRLVARWRRKVIYPGDAMGEAYFASLCAERIVEFCEIPLPERQRRIEADAAFIAEHGGRADSDIEGGVELKTELELRIAADGRAAQIAFKRVRDWLITWDNTGVEPAGLDDDLRTAAEAVRRLRGLVGPTT
jgi:hypothetical protein